MQLISRPRPLLLYGATLSLLAIGVFFIPGIGPALLRTNGYAPHGVCILWQPGLLWFHVTNDVLIGSSYVAIAGTLAYLVYKGRRDLPFHWVLLAFGAFIISCGSTHFMEAWTFWTPLYWLSGYAKLITAVASVATAVALPPLVPRILGLVDSARLSNERKQQLELANVELERLNRRLQELDELKSQLFANVSHELRTPLTLILGPAELLLESASDEQRRALEIIERNARLLQRRVDDLLDIARLESGRLELELAVVDLARLAERTADLFAAAAAERQLRLTVDAPPALSLTGDAEQLQRVIVNLLSNALSFTPDGGALALTVRAEGEAALLAVDDSGPGVPEALREAIFERFRQGDGGATRRHGGTGLGLTIAREIVALHGGTIVAEASPLGGARFVVALPLGAAAAPLRAAPRRSPALAPPSPAARHAEPTAPAADDGDPSRPLVLVVEDSAELRQHLADTLADDYRVRTAADGRDGLAQALALRPDLIVSDVMMPELDGEGLVAAIRRHDGLRDTPIIMLTARADTDLRVRLLREGAQDYLIKPFAAAELRARLANLLAMAQARATLQRTLASQQDNLATLSAEVTRLYQEAQEALRLRQEFLVIAAHELRTPVTALLGNAQLLDRRWGRTEIDAARDLRQVRAIGQAAGRLAALVEALLEVTRADGEAQELRLETLDLGGLARRQAEALQVAFPRHQLRLELPGRPVEVRGDARRLEQLCAALIGNAAKYSPGGGEVTIVLAAAEGVACLSVRDRGIGISAEALPRVFERFYRAPNVDVRRISGFGVGLTLAQRIAEQHGGTITASSAEGEGSTFTFCMPLAGQEGPPAG